MLRPKGIRRGPQKKCFSNAARVVRAADNEAAENPFEYAEGLAIGPDRGMPFEHAWCVREGIAMDPTLQDPMSFGYLGIVVPMKLLWRLQNTNRVFDVLGYQAGQDFMKKWDQVGGDIDHLIKLYPL